jgi:hypothetical protein
MHFPLRRHHLLNYFCFLAVRALEHCLRSDSECLVTARDGQQFLKLLFSSFACSRDHVTRTLSSVRLCLPVGLS